MIRQVLILLVALAAMAGSLVAAWATAAARDADLRGYVDATRDPNLPYRLPRLGVNAELMQYAPSELDAQLDRMDAASMAWVRQVFPWDRIEPEPGVFDWTDWDTIVEAVAEHPDLRLVAVLTNTPGWARQGRAGASATASPDDPADFARFARAFAGRYGATIDHYQIWDEPNLSDAWGGDEPRPAEYFALLSAAYSAIHGSDAGATVLAAALAPTTEEGPDNISDVSYLADLYALGAADVMDAVAGKPYGFDAPPSDRTVSRDTLNFSRIILLREEMVRRGDAKTALWASNWGWNALPADWSGPPSIWGSVTPDEQVAYTLAALERAEREWPWLGPMILYHWQPDAPPDDPRWGFSLLDPQGNPTPLLEALTQRQPAQVATNGLYHPANRFARYSGVWTFGEPGADIGWVQDSQLEFDFAGADIALLVREDDYVAYLYPTVDGAPANGLPRDAAGNAYLILTSDSREPELNLVPLARGLGSGPHRLHVATDRGSDRWALAGFAVSSGNLAAPYDRQIAVALATAGVAALAALIAAWRVDWPRLLAPLSSLWRRLDQTAQLGISALTSLALLAGMLLTWGDATPNLFRREPVQLAVAIVTAGVVYLAPGLLLVLAALAVLFIVFYHRLDIGLALVLFWTPFFLFPVELYTYLFPMAELLLLTLVAAWALRGLVAWGRFRQTTIPAYRGLLWGSFRRHLVTLDYVVAAWLVLAVITLAWTQYRGVALTELRTMVVEPVLFYAILRTAARRPAQLVRLADALLVAGLCVAIIGLWLYLRGEGIITAEEGARRLASAYGSPNNVGLFLGRCVPFALAFALVRTDRRRRVLAGVTLAVMLLAGVLSLSAGALFIGLPASLAAVLLLVLRRRALPVLIALGVAGAVAVAVALRSARFARLLDFREGTNFYRVRVWQSAINILADRPLTGLGLDQFLYAFRGRYILPDAWQEPDLSHPHNIVLDFWIRLGVLGVALLVAFQIAFWSAARRLYRRYRHGDPLLFGLVVGAMGSMVNLLAHGLVDNSVYVNDLAFVFVLLLGLVANLDQTPMPDAEPVAVAASPAPA